MPLPRLLSDPGPLLSYLGRLEALGLGKERARIMESVRTVLRSPEGAILMELLEESIIQSLPAIFADPRASEARVAQSYVVGDLRRIASDETEKLLEQLQDLQGTRRRGRPSTRG